MLEREHFIQRWQPHAQGRSYREYSGKKKLSLVLVTGLTEMSEGR